MARKRISDATPVFEPLPWDSLHFGFSVARVNPRETDEESLWDALGLAREKKVALVYYVASQDDDRTSGSVLAEFCGRLVDRRTTFAGQLSELLHDRIENRAADIRVEEYPAGAASDELLALGVAAGAHSRFRADPRIPPERADRLYSIWMDRSARREIADTVLVAKQQGGNGPGIVAAVTASVQSESGSIGLIAVHEAARRRGVGLSLLSAAHRWMAERRVSRSEVVTQEANEAACSLYRRCGYGIWSSRPYYHFWPCTSSSK